MSQFNIVLTNPGILFNINFGTSSTVVSNVYYDTVADALYAHQIVESSGLPEAMKIGTDGTIYIKGIKVTDSGYSKKFSLTLDGNLVARSFVTEI